MFSIKKKWQKYYKSFVHRVTLKISDSMREVFKAYFVIFILFYFQMVTFNYFLMVPNDVEDHLWFHFVYFLSHLPI